MGLGKVMKTAVMLSMMTALPVSTAMAQAVTAVPAADETRVGAEMNGESQLGGGFIIPLLALAAIIAGILVVLDNDEEPTSP